RRGSIVFGAHIEASSTDQLEGFDGIEIMNLHAHVLKRTKMHILGSLLKLLWPSNWDLGFIMDKVPNMEKWYGLQESGGKLVPVVTGNDSHDNLKILGWNPA